MAAPRLAVITPTLNSAAHVAEALATIVAAGISPLEHVVVDGGSGDATEAAVRAAGARWLARPGTNIYEALNEGLAATSAPLVLFLNSDDRAEPEALAAAIRALEADPRADFAAGKATVFEADAASGRARRTLEPVTVIGSPADRPAALRTLIDAAPLINAHVFRRSFLERVGPFDPSYPVASDRDFMFRVVLAADRALALGAPLVAYRRHPGSRTFFLTRARRLAIADDHRRMAAAWRVRGMGASMEPLLRRWEAEEAALAALLRVGGGDLRAGIAEGLANWRRDLLWPARAAAALAPRLARAALRRIG